MHVYIYLYIQKTFIHSYIYIYIYEHQQLQAHERTCPCGRFKKRGSSLGVHMNTKTYICNENVYNPTSDSEMEPSAQMCGVCMKLSSASGLFDMRHDVGQLEQTRGEKEYGKMLEAPHDWVQEADTLARGDKRAAAPCARNKPKMAESHVLLWPNHTCCYGRITDVVMAESQTLLWPKRMRHFMHTTHASFHAYNACVISCIQRMRHFMHTTHASFHAYNALVASLVTI